MSSFIEEATFDRRRLLQGGGALVIALALPAGVARAATRRGSVDYPPLPLDQLDSYLAIRQDGTVVGAVGKINAGMGVDTAFAQILADELDVPFEQVKILLGDTATTPDQGGTGGSNGVITAGSTLRQAGAQARAFLLGLASAQLGVPASQLTVANGVVSGGGKSVAYADLIGGKQFALKLDPKAKVKTPDQYTVVGQPVKRREIAEIARGRHVYVVDVRVPGMLHARTARPPQAGATLTGIHGPHNLPGVVEVVAKGNYVAVVAKTEWQAITGAQNLRVSWRKPAQPPFPAGYDALYAAMRAATPKATRVAVNTGDVDKAIAGAATTLAASYESAFQSHASMGPACAVADIQGDGGTVWFGGQKPYRVKLAIADLLGLDPGKLRVIWYPGPGSYGSNDADDVAVEAAWLSQQVGAPVRLQWMRHEGTGWDPKAPPAVIDMRAGIDGSGKVVAWDFTSREFSGTQRAPGALKAGDSLIGQLLGYKPEEGNEFALPAESYGFPNERKTATILPWEQAIGTGLRTAHMRDPNGPQTTFASESFVDEVAAALKLDPVQFRLQYLTDPRDVAVVQAAAKAARWDTRPSPKGGQKGTVVRGRGIAYAPRGATYVATVAEVEVDKRTGKVRVLRFTCAHDCGLIINPDGLKGTIEANLVQAMSRALHEQVRFDQWGVKSVDWKTYPVVDIKDTPEVEIVLINRPEVAASGAGEPSTRPTAAAIANAIFDATGVRVRRQPFTPETVLKALRSA